MDPGLRDTLLLKLGPPLIAIAVVLAVARRRGISSRGDLGLAAPRPTALATWLVLWAAWVAVGEGLTGPLGLELPQPWPDYAPAVFWLRVLAIGVLGPVAEELVMRGLALDRLRRTRLRVTGAVVVCAAAWALFHVKYGGPTIAMIFADGLLLGAARVRSGSLLVPCVMHASGNLFSIWQSTHG